MNLLLLELMITLQVFNTTF